MDTYKLIIAGSRNWAAKTKMCFGIQTFHEQFIAKTGRPLEIVSGTASGADQLGTEIANQYNIKLREMPANWNKYGKSAGYQRNVEMAEYAAGCIVFWDGSSPGSKHMIDIAKKHKLDFMLVRDLFTFNHSGNPTPLRLR